VASKVSTFYTNEILSSNYESDKVLLEHPSNPKSMRQSRKSNSLAQVITAADEFPTRHLFADDLGAVLEGLESDSSIPAPPTLESDSQSDKARKEITPIQAESAAQKVAPSTQSASSTQSTPSTPTPSPTLDSWPITPSSQVIVQEPVSVTNSVEGAVQGAVQEGFPAGQGYTDMGPGCS